MLNFFLMVKCSPETINTNLLLWDMREKVKKKQPLYFIPSQSACGYLCS